MTTPPLPPNHELLTTDFLREYGAQKGTILRLSDGECWTETSLPIGSFPTEFALRHYIYAAPLGTTAMVSTPLPEVECDCEPSEEVRDAFGTDFEHGHDCPKNPRNALVKVLPEWLAGCEKKPEGLMVNGCYGAEGVDMAKGWIPEYGVGPLRFFVDASLVYAVPKWVYDAENERRVKLSSTQPPKGGEPCPVNVTAGENSGKWPIVQSTEAKLAGSNAAAEAGPIPAPLAAEVPTPRTDAAMFYQPSDHHGDEVVSADFARTLERELAALSTTNTQNFANAVRHAQRVEHLERELTAAKQRVKELEAESYQETCRQCSRDYSPGLIESGWCIFCILKQVKSERDALRLELASRDECLAVAEALSEKPRALHDDNCARMISARADRFPLHACNCGYAEYCDQRTAALARLTALKQKEGR